MSFSKAQQLPAPSKNGIIKFLLANVQKSTLVFAFSRVRKMETECRALFTTSPKCDVCLRVPRLTLIYPTPRWLQLKSDADTRILFNSGYVRVFFVRAVNIGQNLHRVFQETFAILRDVIYIRPQPSCMWTGGTR